MLTWISEKGAKWVIYIFGAGIVIGLLSLGQTNLDSDRMPPVAKVNGKSVTMAEFKQAYEAALAQYANANIGEEARAQLRAQLLDQQIRAVLMGDQIRAAEVAATVAEMKNDLLNNPPESWKSAEIFQTDSAFDMAKWQRFVSTDSVYDFPFMLGYEQYLKNEKIPAMQLQAFVEAGYHSTDAESKFNVLRRENRMNVDVVYAPVDSFPVEGAVSDEELRKLYEAQPDSFWAPRLMAKFDMVALPVVPSERDAENARKMLDWIRGQMEDGMAFEELASSHSEDQGSAANGGSLGGYQPLDRWVAEFAAAARSLEPGQVSEPVRTSFGWHLIRCNGKKSEEGQELYDLSHILVRVNAGNETLDSLRRVLQAVRTAVVEDGKDFAEAVQAAGLSSSETPWLLRGQSIPGVGAVPGLASWGFADKTREKVSQINDNDQWMTLFSRKAILKPGQRDFALAEARLRERAALESREKAAEAYLKAKVAEWNGEIDSAKVAAAGKLVWNSAELVSTSGYVAGLGMGTAPLAALWNGKDASWSAVQKGERGFAVARATLRQPADPTVVERDAARESANATRFGGRVFLDEWVSTLEKGADVERNLDMYFAE